MKIFKLKPLVLNIIQALTILSLATPLVTYAQDATDLGAVGTSNSSGASSEGTKKPTASAKALSQNSLDARSAQSEISNEFVRDFTSPVADFSQVIQMAPSLWSYSANGPGLGDTKTFFRGFADGDYSITFDGIPFQDTNDPTHHSWAFFPSQFIGGAVVDRSPGSAATLGPANFGGSINLLSRNLETDQRTSVSGSYGSFNTRLMGAEYESGQFGVDGSSNLLINVHQMDSDGYQTGNHQKRDAFSAKYQYAVSENTAITAFASYIEVIANTPNIKGANRAQIAAFGDNFLMSSDPTQANYFGYNHYDVTSDFEYVGITSNLGNGWKVDDKAYTYAYHNAQFYTTPATYTAPYLVASSITPSSTNATDKLNAYRTYGNIFRLSNETNWGTLRTGLWSEYADTKRYQIPSNPQTQVDNPVPNMHETFNTTLLQPFVEYEFKVNDALKVTPGIKYSSYQQNLTQYADNGKTIGTAATLGAASINNSATYTSVLPSLDVHYKLQPNWSIYGQYATGNKIPPSSVFDVAKGLVQAQPKPIQSKTFQVGSGWKSDSFTLDANVYHTTFDNAYSSTPDPVTGEAVYYSNGGSISEGAEVEGTIILGGGFSTYLNATINSAKYDSGIASGQSLANAPKNTQAISFNYEQGAWNTGIFAKRVGAYYQDNQAVHQAVTIDPFVVTNLFINYRFKPTALKQAKVQLAVNNLFDQHNIVAVVPGSVSAVDNITLLPARSASLSLTVDF